VNTIWATDNVLGDFTEIAARPAFYTLHHVDAIPNPRPPSGPVGLGSIGQHPSHLRLEQFPTMRPDLPSPDKRTDVLRGGRLRFMDLMLLSIGSTYRPQILR
jgi:hypothetical protein